MQQAPRRRHGDAEAPVLQVHALLDLLRRHLLGVKPHGAIEGVRGDAGDLELIEGVRAGHRAYLGVHEVREHHAAVLPQPKKHLQDAFTEALEVLRHALADAEDQHHVHVQPAVGSC